MDLIFATEWMLNKNDDDNNHDKDTNDPNKLKIDEDGKEDKMEEKMEEEGPIDWLKMIDEASKDEQVAEQVADQNDDGKLEQIAEQIADEKVDGNVAEQIAEQIAEQDPPEKEATCSCTQKRTAAIPLLDHLCKQFKCSVKELHVLFHTLEKRRAITDHLRSNVVLRTNHLHPFTRNFIVRCNELSTQSAHTVPAYRGYLGISVRVHYYVKHGIRLRYPHLPCVVEYGGGNHKSFYPLEVLSVIKQHSV